MKKIKVEHTILPGLRIIKTIIALILVMIISVCSNGLFAPYDLAVVAIIAIQDDVTQTFKQVKNRIGSTVIGGIIGTKFKNPSNKILSFVLAFASGLMIAIVCFDLLPEAFNLSDLPTAFLGIILGIIAMIFCDMLVDKKFNSNARFKGSKNTLLKTGIIVSIGLAIHNFPEGLAIGSGFGASIKLGLSLAIAICLHDIPEGRFQSRQWLNYL